MRLRILKCSFVLLAFTGTAYSLRGNKTKTRTLTSLRGSRIINYPKDGIGLGQGWDSIHGGRKDAIGIIFQENIAAKGQVKTMNFEKANDKSLLMEAMEISTDMQYSGIIAQASLKFKFASKIETSSISQTFVARAKVENGRNYTAPALEENADMIAQVFDGGKGLDEARKVMPPTKMETLQSLTPDDEPLNVTSLHDGRGGTVRLTPHALELANSDVDEFHRIYGDSFVSAIHSGAELVAALTFDEKERESIRDLDASIEGSGWGFSMNAKFQETVKSYESKNKLKVRYYQAGGSGDPIPTNTDDFLSKIAELPQLAQDAPHPYSITLQRYDTLPNWPSKKLPERPSGYLQTIRSYFEYRSLYDAIQSIQKNPEEFLLGRGTDLDELRQVEEELQLGVEELEHTLYNFGSGHLDELPANKSVPLDYIFRTKMPIPRQYGTTVTWDMEAETLRNFIKEFWLTRASDNRCRTRGFSDLSCLLPSEIEEYAKQIHVNYPVVVGSRMSISSLNSKKPWMDKNRWGNPTSHLEDVTTFRTYSREYGESEGKLAFYIGFADKPGLIRGWRQYATTKNSAAALVKQREWGSFNGFQELRVANFRCWSPQYSDGHCYLRFWIDPTAASHDPIQGWRMEVTTKNSKARFIMKESWGRTSGSNEVRVAGFRAWSSEYGDGHGYLTLVLASS